MFLLSQKENGKFSAKETPWGLLSVANGLSYQQMKKTKRRMFNPGGWGGGKWLKASTENRRSVRKSAPPGHHAGAQSNAATSSGICLRGVSVCIRHNNV